MSDDLILIMEDTEDLMKKAISHLEAELLKIRAGKATPQMLDGIVVDYYGSTTPISQVGNISAMDVRNIAIKKWEKAGPGACRRQGPAALQAEKGGLPQLRSGFAVTEAA